MRLKVFLDGVVLMDPLTWQTHAIARESVHILEFLDEQIAAGIDGRAALVDRALQEALAGDVDAPVEDLATMRLNLLSWVDIALHVRACGERLPQGIVA